MLKEKFINTAMSAVIFTTTVVGCTSADQINDSDNPRKLFESSALFSPELANRYKEVLMESVAKSCDVSNIEFRRWRRVVDPKTAVATHGLMIPPVKEGDSVGILLPAEDDITPGTRKRAQELGINVQEYRGVLQKLSVIHEGIHACSPFESQDTIGLNPAIVDYTEDKIQQDNKGAYHINFKVFRVKNFVNPGLRLTVEMSKVYENGEIETEAFIEPGNTEELVAHWLTKEQVLRTYGATSLEAQVESDGQIYKYGIVALTNIFAVSEADFDDIIQSKRQNDAKTIFELFKKGIDQIGVNNGLKSSASSQESSKMDIYGFLTNLSNQNAQLNHLDLEILADSLSKYFFSRLFKDTSVGQKNQLTAVFAQIFKD